jgi:uncharacterized protein YdhG (YjbR/CyaY superfamily)
MEKKGATVEEYISSFPKEVQDRLQLIRKVIKNNAPEAIENIAYGMPAYKMNKKPLVYFGGYAKHIGFYATPTGHEKFKKAVITIQARKRFSTVSIRPDLPLDLIAEMVKFRVLENMRFLK